MKWSKWPAWRQTLQVRINISWEKFPVFGSEGRVLQNWGYEIVRSKQMYLRCVDGNWRLDARYISSDFGKDFAEQDHRCRRNWGGKQVKKTIYANFPRKPRGGWGSFAKVRIKGATENTPGEWGKKWDTRESKQDTGYRCAGSETCLLPAPSW